MQKTVHTGLIAAAVAAALGFSSTAAAEATVYGKLHVSAGAIAQDDGTDYSSTAVASHASRIGAKADKALANGMTIKGQLEFEVDTVGDKTKSSEDLIKARNSYVGLKGGFGEVRVGYHDTPHKMATAKLDPLSDTYADYNNVVLTDTRAANAIAYMNTFGKVSIGLAYAGGNDSVTAENEGAATSAMIAYEGDALYLTAAIESFDDVAAGDTESSTKLGVGYSVGPVKLGLVYDIEDLKDAEEDTAIYASLQWKVTDNGTVKAAYGQLDVDAADDDPTFYALAYDHKLDKSASVYVLYASGQDDGLSHKGKLKGDGTAAVIGAVYKF